MIDPEQLAAYLAGELAADRRAAFEEALADDPAAVRDLLDQERMDAALRVLLGPPEHRERVKRSILEVVSGPDARQVRSGVIRAVTREAAHAESSGRPRRLRWIGLVAGLAAAAALAFVLRWVVAPAPDGGPAVARIEAAAGAVKVLRAAGGFAAVRDLALRPEDAVEVGEGASASIRYADGTRLELEAGTALRFGGDDLLHLVLDRGGLAAGVTKQPEGRSMRIRTALAEATVHGTRFTMSAGPRASRVDVSEGRVRVAHTGRDSAVELAAGEFALAVPEAELVAGAEPAAATPRAAGASDGRDYARRPFADDSPWNRTLAAGAHYEDIRSEALDPAGHGATVVPASHERPIWIARPGDPARRIVLRYGGGEAGSLPAPALPEGGRAANGTLIDPARAVAWELVQASGRGPDIEVMMCLRHDLRGSGAPPDQAGHTFSGLPLLAGIVRDGELERGIPHALAVSALHEGLARCGPGGSAFVAPARHMPIEEHKLARLGAIGNVCYGTRLALPPGEDLAALGIATNGPAFELARALQRYGALVTHSYPGVPVAQTGGWKQPHLQFFAELPGGARDPELDRAVSRLAARLKVVMP